MAELMEVRILQLYDQQSCLTTFHYLASGTPAAVTRSFAMLAAMGFIDGVTPDVGNVFGRWKTLVSDALVFPEVTAKAVYSLTDFYTLPLLANNMGSATGQPTSAFSAFPFQTSRVRSDIRRGNKRLVGVIEDAITDFGEVSITYKGYADLLAVDFTSTLTYDDEGNTLTFIPVVVSKEPYVTPSGKTAYQYYDTEIEQALHLATGVLWFAKDFATTQSSRKRGRGA